MCIYSPFAVEPDVSLVELPENVCPGVLLAPRVPVGELDCVDGHETGLPMEALGVDLCRVRVVPAELEAGGVTLVVGEALKA